MKYIPTNHHGPTAFRAFPILAAIAFVGLGASARAAVTVVGTTTFNSGLYTYSYSVTNTGTEFDLIEIDIPMGANVAVSNGTAPSMFQIVTDAPPYVSFLGGSDPFNPGTFSPGSTVAFFTYDSPTAPSPVTFLAQDANGENYTGQTIGAVPEPSGMMLLAASAFSLIGIRKRRNH